MSSGEPGQRDEGNESSRQRGLLWGSAAADVWVSGDSERPAWSQQASSSWVPAVEPEQLHEPRAIPAKGGEGRNVVLTVAAAIMLVGFVAAGIGGIGGTGGIGGIGRSGENSGQEVDVALSPPPSDTELQSGELPVSIDGPFVASGGADVSAPADKVTADVGSGQENVAPSPLPSTPLPSSPLPSASSGSGSSSPSSPADTDGSTSPETRPLPPADQPVAPSAPSQPADPGSGVDPSTDGTPSLDDRVDVPAIDQAALRARQTHAELAALSRRQLVAMAGDACGAQTLGEAVSVASSRSGISAGPIRSWLRSGTKILCPNAH